jgi:dTMP kinase
VVFEGGEGAGKTQQVGRAVEWLSGALETVRTREPGGTPGGEALRSMILSGDHDWSPRAETLLHFAIRAQHVDRLIRPAVARGAFVVCDRFYDSTLAYQGHGQGTDKDFIRAQIGLLGFRPDLTVVLDVSEEEAARRLAARGLGPDRYDRLGEAFHRRVRRAFREIAEAEPDRCRVVDGHGDIDTVASRVRCEVLALLERRQMDSLADALRGSAANPRVGT